METEPTRPSVVFGAVTLGILLPLAAVMTLFMSVLVEGLGEGKTMKADSVIETFVVVVIAAVLAGCAFEVGSIKRAHTVSAERVPTAAVVATFIALAGWWTLVSLRFVPQYVAMLLPFAVCGYYAPRHAKKERPVPDTNA